MAQINVRINSEIDEIITLLASEKDLSRSVVARDLIMQGLNQVLLPTLAKWYEEGKISLKKIALLTGLPPVDLIEQISHLINTSPMTEKLEEYTTSIADKVILHLQNK